MSPVAHGAREESLEEDSSPPSGAERLGEVGALSGSLMIAATTPLGSLASVADLSP
jgi:hypothetical protein